MRSSYNPLGRIGTFFSPNKIIFGVGSAKEVGTEAKSLGGEKVLIITDPGVTEVGIADDIRKTIVSENLKVDIFDGVELEPPSRVVDECAALIRREKFNVIVGVGGGSSLDTAKMASIMATNEGKILDYAGKDIVTQKGVPKILLPTTAGSGAEVSRAAGVTDELENTKRIVYSVHNLPDAAILDPSLTISLPNRLTAETGIDALAHAIETYVSVAATPFSEILAIEAIRLVAHNLPVAYAKGENLEARFNMLLAANLAALAMGSGQLGAVHGLAFVLEPEFNLGHAKAVSIMLPHVMDFNKIGNLKKYGNIAKAMGERIDELSDQHAAEKSVTSVKRLLENVNLSFKLSDYGVSKEKLPSLVDKSVQNSMLFIPNPRNLSEDDISKILLEALA